MTEGLHVTVRGVHGVVLGEHFTTFGVGTLKQAACSGQATCVSGGAGERISADLDGSGVDLPSEEASCEVQVFDPQDDVGETKGAGLDARSLDLQ